MAKGASPSEQFGAAQGTLERFFSYLQFSHTEQFGTTEGPLEHMVRFGELPVGALEDQTEPTFHSPPDN